MPSNAVIMRNITKKFTGLYRTVVADDHVDLTVEQGEIHVIVGENGAGKSTLMNILYGMLQPDEGDIEIFGHKATVPNPETAIQLGIGMVHQHFMLVPSFTVGENIVLGQEPAKLSLLDQEIIRSQVGSLSARLGLSVNADARVSSLPVGVQQRVEILKALYRGARVLILDEPTAVLTPQEVDTLFQALRRLAGEGTSIIMITHKLSEVMALADRVTVLRDGKLIGTVRASELDERRLAEMMTGRPYVPNRFPREKRTGGTVLALENVSYVDKRRVCILRDVSFTLRAGEIVGIAGVAHNGQDELAEVISGQLGPSAGQIFFKGQEITRQPARAIREAGMGHIPGDRYGEGCARDASLFRNMLMGLHYRPPLAHKGVIRTQKAADWVNNLIAEFEIKASHANMPILSLSGGNVQKAIVAREVSMAQHLLIAEQPSRGVDIGAAEFIYEKIMALRSAGAAVLLISTDLNEILRLSDRILVIYSGAIVGERDPEKTTQAELGLLMAGVD